MKITKGRLKEIIKEELTNEASGRIPMATSGGPGYRAPGIPAAPAPEMPTDTPEPELADESELRDRLMGMVMSYYRVSKADSNVPNHVLRAFERLAQEIAKG